ncbi:sister chromatid cohesion protein Dcc1 [Pholiota molesta]|nr:sister chromatid cohesion protein Dcc1 [Pholiota molesta]
MPEYDLNFSPFSSNEADSFKLVELPPDLTALIENAINNEEDISLTIKGQPNEDAVLCTGDKTFAMRSIGLSNTILVVTPVQDDYASNFANDALAIRDQVSEIMELIPAVPKMHKLTGLLRERQYDDSSEDDIYEEDGTQIHYTYDDARAEIQASDAELDKGLKDRRILIINNELRPIKPEYLNRLLELILNLLISLSMKYTSVSVEQLSSVLADGHEVPRAVSTQIMAWFGELKDGRWKMDVGSVVRELGLGILRNHRHDPISQGDLLLRWKTQVGDTFESLVSIGLLEGNYIESETINYGDNLTLKYFPASDLPVDPAARFSDLFLTRKKWKGEDISPFLSDIAVNSKERDKLLLKYCRTVTESGGVRYTARAQYNG